MKRNGFERNGIARETTSVDTGTGGTVFRHRYGGRRQWASFIFLLSLVLLLAACSETVSPPGPEPTDPPPPAENSGSLLIDVTGLPEEAKAAVLVTGPEDYEVVVEGDRTLEVRSGTYTVEVDAVVYEGETFTGSIAETARAQEVLDISVGERVSVDVRYTSVGTVGPGEIAPGVTRSGIVGEAAFDDYTFEGIENVPLAFDFTGTGQETSGFYSVSIFRAGDLDDPLLVRDRISSSGRDPVLGFAPPETGSYVLRIRGTYSTTDYQVEARFLNGPSETRLSPETLELGEVAGGQ